MKLDKKYKNKKLEAKRQENLKVIEQQARLQSSRKLSLPFKVVMQNLRSCLESGDFPHYLNEKDDLLKKILHVIYDSKLKDKASQAAFIDLIEICHEQTDFLTQRDDKYIYGLANIAFWDIFWERDASGWKNKTHNIDKQFSSLLRFIFAKYKVPLFMDSCFLQMKNNKCLKQQEWFIHIGKGQNIRTAHGLPFQLTKKMAHYFCEAPNQYTIDQAFRYGQILGLGGSHNTVNGILKSRLSTLVEFKSEKIEDFWQQVILFFAQNSMVDPEKIPIIIDYIYSQKFQIRGEFDHVTNQFINQDPINPDWSIKGRTINSLLRATEVWHNDLHKSKNKRSLFWPQKSNIHKMRFKEGSEENPQVYEIKEILSSKELNVEGKEMHHCVASYDLRCHKLEYAIFSLKIDSAKNSAHRSTIAVDIKRKEVTEVRGLSNSKPSEKAKRFVSSWARTNNLKISDFAY